MVGRVVFSRANRHNSLSQLSRHPSCNREYSIVLGVARVMSSKLLMELHKRYSLVSLKSSEMQSICIYVAYRGGYVSGP